MSHRLPVVVVERPQEYGPGYPAECLFADTTSPSVYWCTLQNPTFPVVMTLEVTAADATVERLLFDTRVKGWESSAAKRVTLDVSTPDEPDAFAQVADLELTFDALQHIVLARPTPAARVRVTMHSNHGGAYVVLQRLQVFGAAVGVGEVMLPPGAHVTAAQREGVVIAAGYQVRWDDESVDWVPAGEVRPSARPAVTKRKRMPRTKARGD